MCMGVCKHAENVMTSLCQKAANWIQDAWLDTQSPQSSVKCLERPHIHTQDTKLRHRAPARHPESTELSEVS